MTDITVTATKVAVIDPEKAKIRSLVAAVAVNAGQTVAWDSSGKAILCDANDTGKEQFRGVALQSVGIGQAVDVCEEGELEGFTVSSLNCDAILYQSDTAGALADAASATKTVACARVVAMTDKAGTKVVRVFTRLSANW